MTMKRSVFWTLVLLAVMPMPVVRTWGQSIPPVNAKALDDSQVVLPKGGSKQLLILVLGFSHKSGDHCTPWDKRLGSDFRSDAQVEYYQIPVLAGAPSFVRPMILKGMRKGIPTSEQARFVPIYDHEAEWKKLVSFAEADDPYIVLARPDGSVIWRTHGQFTDAAYGELKTAIAKALSGGARN